MADPAAPSPARPRVLVVDDDRMVLESTRMVLETSGFDVTVCNRSERAVDEARRCAPDLVLLDLMMPGADGWEVLRRLRAEIWTRDTPVVVFTAKEHRMGRKLAQDLGAADYVQKPFDSDRLVRLVRGLVSARSGA